MKNFIFIFFFLQLLFLNVQAQSEAKQPQAADFTLTDTQGNTFHLFDELATGKTVVLDFFSVICGSCATSVSVLDQLWHANSTIGNGLWVWGIEVYMATNAQIDTFSVENGGTYPCFSADENDSIMQQYDIQYTPRFYVVCPDKRRIPSLLGEIQFNIDQCRSASDIKTPEERNNTIVFMSDNEMLYFSFSENLSGLFEIIDVYGRVITAITLHSENTNQVKIQKSELSTGIYFYHFTGKNKRINGKFMVL